MYDVYIFAQLRVCRWRWRVLHHLMSQRLYTSYFCFCNTLTLFVFVARFRSCFNLARCVCVRWFRFVCFGENVRMRFSPFRAYNCTHLCMCVFSRQQQLCNCEVTAKLTIHFFQTHIFHTHTRIYIPTRAYLDMYLLANR